jgi:hypothetical protein
VCGDYEQAVGVLVCALSSSGDMKNERERRIRMDAMWIDDARWVVDGIRY